MDIPVAEDIAGTPAAVVRTLAVAGSLAVDILAGDRAPRLVLANHIRFDSACRAGLRSSLLLCLLLSRMLVLGRLVGGRLGGWCSLGVGPRVLPEGLVRSSFALCSWRGLGLFGGGEGEWG